MRVAKAGVNVVFLFGSPYSYHKLEIRAFIDGAPYYPKTYEMHSTPNPDHVCGRLCIQMDVT